MLTDQLRTLIDAAEVVSFDVFDTLLLRRHYAPHDVFEHAASGGAWWFRRLRIAAEILARFRHRPRQDVTLTQIYAILRHSPLRELEAETQTLYANPAARTIYDYAVSRGKTIIAVSDMYLPAAFLAEAVTRAGYGEVRKIYVSSEAGLTKTTGDLFAHVATDLRVAPSRIVHIGDNPHSDVSKATERGLSAWHLPSPRERFELRRAVHPEILRYLRRGRQPDHSLLLGMFRDGLSDHSLPRDYWYALGFTVAGPVINAFVNWVHERFQSGNHSRIFLFSRDGDLPMKVLAIRKPVVPTHYTYASRRLFLVPALERLNPTNMAALCAALPGTRASEFWERLGIADAGVEKLLAEHFPADDRIWSAADRRRLKNFFRQAHPLMHPHIARENAVLRAYLSAIGVMGAGKRPLLVDVGWRATSQRFLEMAVPDLAGTTGAYFGLSDDAYRNGAMSGWFFDGLTPIRARRIATECVEIMELLFSASHPSILRIEKGADDEFVPVYEPPGPSEEARAEIVRRIHEGAVDFTRRLAQHEQAGYRIRITHRDAVALLQSVVLRPTAEDVAHLGRLPHSVGLGASTTETLLPERLPAQPLALVAQNLGASPVRVHWPAGLARAIGPERGGLRHITWKVGLTAARVVLAVRERWDRLLRR
ncbi:MAG: hypothetical protein ACXW5U_07605 [Thermoanaerobaculia bacterium]